MFVLYTTSCANNNVTKGKRKTLSSTDVLAAMEEMEFETLIEPLKESLEVMLPHRTADVYSSRNINCKKM